MRPVITDRQSETKTGRASASVPPPTRIAGGVLATFALVAIVVVVPALLITVGGSPFSHLDPVGALRSLDPHRSDNPRSTVLVLNWLVRGPLLVAWVLWLWTTVCVVLEVRSRITGRTSARLPASRNLQSLAACLVGTALALAAAGRMPAGPAGTGGSATLSVGVPFLGAEAGLPPIRVIEELAEVKDVRHPAGGPAPDPLSCTPAGVQVPRVERSTLPLDPSQPTSDPAHDVTAEGGSAAGRGVRVLAADPGRRHRVRPRETLWSVAAGQLGSALRWRELAALNYGIPQSDGGSLTSDHWIRAGWLLELPEDSPLPEGSRRPAVSGRGSTPLPIAFGRFSGTPLVTGGTGSDRAVIPDAARTGSFTNPIPLHPPHPPAVPLGGGVVGAGIVNILDRLRRVQQRHRPGGMFIRLPDHPYRLFEGRLRAGDGREVIRAADRALVLLAEECRRSGMLAPIVEGITVGHETIEVTVDPDSPIASIDVRGGLFTVLSGGGIIAMDRRVLAAMDQGDGWAVSSLAPLMVTAGQRMEGLALVNLESLGTVAVSGDRGACEAVLRALALELATSFWSGRFDLLLVGFGAELERFARVKAIADPSAMLDAVSLRRVSAAQMLDQTGHSSFARGRWADQSSRWDPLAILCGPAVAEDAVRELFESISSPHLGIAAVATTVSADGCPVTFSGPARESSLDLLRAVVLPQQVDATEFREVASLVELAGDRRPMLRSDEPYLSLPVPMPLQSPAEGAEDTEPAERTRRTEGAERTDGTGRISDSPARGMPSRPPAVTPPANEHEVEVSILGHVEIRGAVRPFTRAWSKELVVYLAVHPHGATNDAWATALWPDRIMAPSSLHSTASVARRALGRARSGHDHLPHSHGRLALADTVGTDWDRFVALADSGDVESWKSALELVRGRPFEDLRASDWPILEGIGPAIESAVVDLSCRLAGACLSAGDARGAEWAARRGLLVSPYDERLYRILMQAADLAGNPAGVEGAMSELVKLVADDIEPFDSVHPSTVQLYRSLTRRGITTDRAR